MNAENRMLEPREGWQINPLRRCYERHTERLPISIYPYEAGFVASVSGTWIEGYWPVFDDAAAAAAEAAK